MIREDYVMRLIKQLAVAIARMAGLRAKGDHQGALRAAEAGYDALGVPPDLAAAVDSATLADLLRHPDKIRAMAQLSAAEAESLCAVSDAALGAMRYRRAAELLLELRLRGAPSEPDDDVLLAACFVHVPTALLAPAYRSVT